MDYLYLDKIKQPSDIKNMTPSELELLCDEIRDALIFNISNSGGHLASNLGVVELTVAIHNVFDSPNDQIVFDVGHQCYVHKLLTGRYSSFNTLRKKGGLSGFPNPEESTHDIFKTGHSSTSISSALGLAYANALLNKDSTSVAVIGDGSITGGLAFEGLNNAGSSNKNIIVILNDNNMSISKNVGSVSKMLTRLRTNSGYFKSKDVFAHITAKIPFFGKGLYKWLVKLKSAIKAYFYSSNMFEAMGFKYIGPIDGHDIKAIVRVLNRAKSLGCPVFVHVKTKKGKGYSFAERKPDLYHGVGEFDINTGASNGENRLSYTDAFGLSLLRIAKENDKVCAITAAMGDSCGLLPFKNAFPERFFDVGIAEQHAVTFASGLAKNGMIPVFAVYSTFFQRAYDQIIHDVSLQNLKVIFALDRAGFSGNDGETHQGLFDISMILPIPNIKIYSPSTATELEKTLESAINVNETCSVIRYPKDNCINYNDYPLSLDNLDYSILCNNSENVIITFGREIFDVLSALPENKPDVIKLNLINHFDKKLIDIIFKYKKIVFVEENYSIGGIAALLSSILVEHKYSGEFYSIGIKNDFIKHASQQSCKIDAGIDSDSLKFKFKQIFN